MSCQSGAKARGELAELMIVQYSPSCRPRLIAGKPMHQAIFVYPIGINHILEILYG